MEAHRFSESNSFEESTRTFDEFVKQLQSVEACQLTAGGLERLFKKDGFELLRRLLQDHLDYRGPGFVADVVVGQEGVTRTQSRPGARNLDTIFGTVVVNRQGYGTPGLCSLFPFDAALNLPKELQSHGLRREFAVEASKTSYAESVASVQEATTVAVGKRQAEELVIKAAQDFDDFYETRTVPQAMIEHTGPIEVVTVDQKGVVMRHDDLLDATKKAAEEQRHKKTKRLSKGEKKNSKRMATVAAVYTIEPMFRRPEDIVRELRGVQAIEAKAARPRPESKRVWASIEKRLADVVLDAVEEGVRRDPSHQKRWVALVDGNKSQIRLLKKYAKQNGIAMTIIVDIIHVVEYIWKASYALNDEATQEAEDWVTERFLLVLQGHAGSVAGGMRRSATLRGLSSEERKAVDTCAKYLTTYAPYLKYDKYLAAGYPIATGVIEGACRHLVKDRLDITGARWGLRSAEAILRLRSLRSSGDFDEYWTFHEAREYERNHSTQFKYGIIPPVLQPQHADSRASRPALRVVK